MVNYMSCVYTAVDQIYATGARYIVLMNIAPLELAPMYANASEGGVGPTNYWPQAPPNLTATAEQMRVRV